MREFREAVVDALDGQARALEAASRAYQGRAWIAPGYGTWEEFVREEIGPVRLWKTVEERRDPAEAPY